MDQEPLTDPSHAPSPPISQITDKETTAARDQPPNVPAENGQVQETGAGTDLGQGTPDPASDVSSTSDPTPIKSANKPKSAFVKIMELDKEDLLMAWIEAFIGRCFVIQV
jgi:hypothetical protein